MEVNREDVLGSNSLLPSSVPVRRVNIYGISFEAEAVSASCFSAKQVTSHHTLPWSSSSRLRCIQTNKARLMIKPGNLMFVERINETVSSSVVRSVQHHKDSLLPLVYTTTLSEESCQRAPANTRRPSLAVCEDAIFRSVVVVFQPPTVVLAVLQHSLLLTLSIGKSISRTLLLRHVFQHLGN